MEEMIPNNLNKLILFLILAGVLTAIVIGLVYLIVGDL